MIYLSKAKFYVSQMTEGIRTLADLGIGPRGNSKFGSDSKTFHFRGNMNIVERDTKYDNSM